jgi:hypothetical protein
MAKIRCRGFIAAAFSLAAAPQAGRLDADVQVVAAFACRTPHPALDFVPVLPAFRHHCGRSGQWYFCVQEQFSPAPSVTRYAIS